VRPRRFLLVALAVAAIAFLQVVLERNDRTYDLTAEHTLSLTSETTAVVRQVHHPVRVTAFLRPEEAGRPEEAALLDRYHRLNRRITYRVIDPDAAPGETRRLDIDPVFGGMALEQGTRVERAPTVTEQDVTAGLARLLRRHVPTLCAATGHGEAAIDATVNDGLSTAAALLRENGFRLRAIDLLVEPAVPDGCDGLLLVRPTAPLGPAQQAVGAYLAGGGRAVVLTDPVSSVDLNPLLAPYGVGIDRGIVFESAPDAHLRGDPTSLVVRQYQGGTPVARGLPPTVFPGAQGVTSAEHLERGIAVAAFAQTSSASYLSRRAERAEFDPNNDVRGPITVAAAVDRSATVAGKAQRTRLVVTGDADFAANGSIGDAGNSRLVIQASEWVTLQEDLVTVDANLPTVRPLALTDARRRYVLFLTVGVVPGLILLAGVMVWAVRRGR